VILLDTHVLLWFFQGDLRLAADKRALIEDSSGEDGVYVSAITPWEIAMLEAKGRYNVGQDIRAWMAGVFAAPGIRLAPLEPAIAIDSNNLPGEMHGDPADRIIIASARFLGCPLLTADRAILAYAEQGHLTAIDASR
jgi:PIN domain nuclease of toxin-antitoxin system